MRTAFHKIIANVRAALDHKAAALAVHAEPAPEVVPIAPGARRAELVSQFARELERVSGHFMGVLSAAEAQESIARIARQLKVKSAAIGEGVRMDFAPIAQMLERAGIALIRPHRVADGERAALRESIANCGLGIVEADYAIAATGTLAIVATPERPNSLTLLPPANVIVVDAERILPDLAAVIAAIGPATFASNRVALITGPSRTADIEKMIVLGVHGPRQLYAAAVWH